MHFGYKVLNEESVKAPKSKIKAKDRPGEKYETSRWTPLLQDIAEVLTHYFHVLYVRKIIFVTLTKFKKLCVHVA